MNNENYKLLFFCAILASIFAWSGYKLGYGDAREEYARPIKYKCIDGFVQRDIGPYFEQTTQKCKLKEVAYSTKETT